MSIQRRLNRNINEEEQDFIHVMLSAMDDGKISAQDANTVIKANCLVAIYHSGQAWTLSLLLTNRHVLKKVQDELNLHVGKQRQVDDTTRVHDSIEDCTVAGFHIPAGTWLFVNLWKLHRDPSIWLNPSEFIPERFLNYHANLDARGLHFEYLPFSSGRRKCPGISFELQVLHLTLARLLHAFELGTVSDTIVDMSEGPGLTVPKATPLEVIVTPRLPSMLYDFNKQEE
ncbi:hypothetical protein EZV62_022107 [Acer yangbiense]|uniref:Cytochrome P450 n=1 Tax=Acer yangbiense TaxID=1000413 RepID=A0A5C7H7D2_9ROSI|nr:hypothetical protein EZV62_022107 [Acer yangbiense]